IGMYRSTYNVVTGNRVDYNVRGYSHGFFRRGQDSANLLMFEQSSNNIVSGNSMTHGGDGLFLWAGQTTMDNGKGGANDNLFIDNDFSFAPTNGMEATFSRNTFIANRSAGSDYGFWGGYSYDSRVIGNCFSKNRIAIAIEHGQDNVISSNRFDGDSIGIKLWADSIEPSDWGYPKSRDTRSRDYRIDGNWLTNTRIAVQVVRTTPIDSANNGNRASAMLQCDSKAIAHALFDSATKGLASDTKTMMRTALSQTMLSRPEPSVAMRDRSAIVVDEWGPYDWRSPKLWPIDSTRSTSLRLRVLGPNGTWHLVSKSRVASISASSGRVGDTIAVTPQRDSANVDWSVELEYRGEPTVEQNGAKHAAGTPMRFSYSRSEPKNNWHVKFFAWNDSTDFRAKAKAFDALMQRTPIADRFETRLDYFWYRPTVPNVPQAKFAIDARSDVTLPPGTYTIRTISDDAVRVWVDDSLVIDHWTPHESAPAYAPLSGGTHHLRVQYAQIDGWAELRLELLRGLVKGSVGSAGPH
ncbi:MAG: PA14 domain-containing protein, partial [Gemmatimonadaceae bacterium]